MDIIGQQEKPVPKQQLKKAKRTAELAGNFQMLENIKTNNSITLDKFKQIDADYKILLDAKRQNAWDVEQQETHRKEAIVAQQPDFIITQLSRSIQEQVSRLVFAQNKGASVAKTFDLRRNNVPEQFDREFGVFTANGKEFVINRPIDALYIYWKIEKPYSDYCKASHQVSQAVLKKYALHTDLIKILEYARGLMTKLSKKQQASP